MTFVVEDGTGTVATANSYISLVEFAAYWLDRGVDVALIAGITYTSTQQQTALVRGTDYIDLVFGPRFGGYRLLFDQPLEFPRQCLYATGDPFLTPVTGIPEKLKKATAEYGMRAMTGNGDLLPDPVMDETGLQVQSLFEKVGPIEERRVFLGSSVRTILPYPKADAYLESYISGTQGGSCRA